MSTVVPLFSAKLANAGLDFHTPLDRVLNSYWYILGSEVITFEQEFAAYCGVSECVSVANGSDALELGLRACGVSAGDEVLLAANAGFYGSSAVRSIAAKPVYVEIAADTLTISAKDLADKLLTSKAKAIIVTHLYGQVAEIGKIAELAESNGVPLIEDCAQSHGARVNGQCAGSFGSIGCFSFYPTKNLGALGDGGAVVSNDRELCARLRSLRQYGWSSKYNVEISGGRNSRLDEMQAAILRVKLPLLEDCNVRRREIAAAYNRAFEDLPVRCPPSTGDDYVAHLYVLQVDNRASFRAYLKQHEIATDVHYPVADHKQHAYMHETADISLPVTEAACEAVVSIPCFPGLTDGEVAWVISIVQNYFLEGIR